MFARVLMWLARRMALIGRPDRARRRAMAALAVRRLRGGDPIRLAAGLVVLSRANGLAGRYAEAEAAAREALTRARTDPATLAWANWALAESLYGQRRFLDGLPHAEAAAAHLREAAPARGIWLARALFTCGRLHVALDRPADALDVLQEGLAVCDAQPILRQSRQAEPVVIATANLAWAYLQTEQYDQALASADRSAGIARPLSRIQPRRFGPLHATALFYAALAHHHLNQPHQAIDAARHSEEAYRPFATRRFDRASVLALLADLLRAANRDLEADQVEEQVIALYRTLADSEPARAVPHLCDTLAARGARQWRADDTGAGLASQAELVTALRPLAEADPNHLRRLVLELGVLALRMESVHGTMDGALEPANEAVALARTRESEPDHLLVLGSALRRRASVYCDHDTAAALRDTEAAIPLLRTAASAPGSRHAARTELERVLDRKVSLLRESEAGDEAAEQLVETLREQVELLRDRPTTPELTDHLAWVYRRMFEAHRALDQPEPAIAAATESIELRRSLVTPGSDEQVALIAYTQVDRAGGLTVTGQIDAARRDLEEALVIFRAISERDSQHAYMMAKVQHRLEELDG